MSLPRKCWIVIALLLTACGAVVAQELDTTALLRRVDEVASVDESDFTAVTTVISQDPEEGTERTVVRLHRRDRQDLFLILIREPEIQRGQGYLRVQDGLWAYDPESRRFTYSSMRESFQGTDARNSDFEAARFARDYEVVSYGSGTLGQYDVWILEVEGTNEEVTYPYRTLWVTRDESPLVLKAEDYSLSRRLVRTSYYPQYTRVGESFVASRILLVDELVDGKRTQISLEDISLSDLADEVFTKAYVERENR